MNQKSRACLIVLAIALPLFSVTLKVRKRIDRKNGIQHLPAIEFGVFCPNVLRDWNIIFLEWVDEPDLLFLQACCDPETVRSALRRAELGTVPQ